MFNKNILLDILAKYKEDFATSHYVDVKNKLEAIKCFQENWNIDSPNFSEMLTKSLKNVEHIITSSKSSLHSILEYSKTNPEELRAMFTSLFDENIDIENRIFEFKDKTIGQYEDAISTYLWLKYPAKYFVYKFDTIKTIAAKIKSDIRFNTSVFASVSSTNFKNSMLLYNEICEYVIENDNNKTLFELVLKNETDSNIVYNTITIDLFSYIIDNNSSYLHSNYNPGFTVEDWIKLLQDESIFNRNSLEIMKRMKDAGGQATCTQLAKKYGESNNFYNSGSSALAKRIKTKTNCPTISNDTKLWPILYLGKKAGKAEEGVFIWKLRDELKQALDSVDLSDISLYAGVNNDEVNYWWINASPKIWSFNSMAVGETQSYSFYNENDNKRRIFQNFLDIKVGDIAIGYEATPVKQIVSICKITAIEEGKQFFFEKLESLANPIDYSTLRSSEKLANMEYFVASQGSLFKLTKDEYSYILDLIRDENPIKNESEHISYAKEDFLNEVYMSESRYNMLTAVLKNKKNIILQGAPGVGKTYAAKRIAYSIMGEKDENRVEFIQFHQNYSYEDFVMGYKPEGDSFELKNGIFYRFCQKAMNRPDKDFFFIIDEINRGNMSKIFGELLMLIEKDYRGEKATLAYNGLSFFVPKNLYIIGMMNTADRSLAMIDYALRRRFSFFDILPGFDSEGFINYKNKFNNVNFNAVIDKVCELNKEIERDKSLGKGFCIGHSYFCNVEECTNEWLKAVVDFDILPMLAEYWFDDENTLKRWESIFSGVIND